MKNLTDFRKTVETGVDPRLNRTSLDIKVFIIWPRSGRSPGHGQPRILPPSYAPAIYVGLARGWIYLPLIWSLCIDPLHF